MGQGQLTQAAATFESAGHDRRAGGVLHRLGPRRSRAVRGPAPRTPRRSSRRAPPPTWRPRTPDRAANKFAALAYTQLLRGQKAAAVAAAEKALANSQAVKIRFLAARVFVEAGAAAKAGTISAGARRRAPGRASGLRQDHRRPDGAQERRPAPRRSSCSPTPTICWTRGSATSISAVPIWTPARSRRPIPSSTAASSAAARRCRCSSTRSPPTATSRRSTTTRAACREGLNSAKAAESYRAYLDIRGKSTEDPLLPDVRRRAAASGTQ